MCKVSVIVPNYNHEKYLKQRIESIFQQSFKDIEIILLDDNSTDDSREIMLKYKNSSKVKHIEFNSKNSGSTFEQWNKGIQLAKGEYIWIAESDDFSSENFLEVLINQLEERPLVGMAYTLSNFVDSNGDLLWNTRESGEIIEYAGFEYLTNRLLIFNSIVNVSMVVFRASVIKLIDRKLFKDMMFCGDWFFYVLVCEKAKVLEVNQAYNYYRIHLQNVSSSAENSGLTFLEGIRILEYIESRYSISSYSYSFKYAKYWLSNKTKYKYSIETNNLIKQAFFENHKLIVFYYYFLLVHRKVRNFLNK